MSESSSRRKKKRDRKDGRTEGMGQRARHPPVVYSELPKRGSGACGWSDTEKEQTLWSVKQCQTLWGLQKDCSEDLIHVQFILNLKLIIF